MRPSRKGMRESALPGTDAEASSSVLQLTYDLRRVHLGIRRRALLLPALSLWPFQYPIPLITRVVVVSAIDLERNEPLSFILQQALHEVGQIVRTRDGVPPNRHDDTVPVIEGPTDILDHPSRAHDQLLASRTLERDDLAVDVVQPERPIESFLTRASAVLRHPPLLANGPVALIVHAHHLGLVGDGHHPVSFRPLLTTLCPHRFHLPSLCAIDALGCLFWRR